MALEQSPQLPTADAKSSSQGLDVGVLAVECAVGDEPSARLTVLAVPRQKARSGAISGRQRRQGRKPASCAAAAEAKKRQFSNLGGRVGQIGRQ
jgi:hypothetical protein